MDSSHVELSCDVVYSRDNAHTQNSPRSFSATTSESGLACPLLTLSTETDRTHNADVNTFPRCTNNEPVMSLLPGASLSDGSKEPSLVTLPPPNELGNIVHTMTGATDIHNSDNRAEHTAANNSSYASLSPNLSSITSCTSKPASNDTFASAFTSITTTTNPTNAVTTAEHPSKSALHLTSDSMVTRNVELAPVMFTHDSTFLSSESSIASNSASTNPLASFATMPDSTELPRTVGTIADPSLALSNSSVTNFDQQQLISSSQLSYLPASVASAPLPKSFPFTLMPISPNGDFPAVQLTLPDLPAVILQVLPLPGAKMGEQYTINVPTPLILSGINSALANGGTMNGGPIMLSIAPSGTLPQSCPNMSSVNLNPNEISGSCPQEISSGYGATSSNLTLFNIPVPSSSNLSVVSLSSPQLGAPAASITKRMRAIAPKPCFNLPTTSLNGSSSTTTTSTSSVSKVSQSRSSSKKGTSGTAATTAVSSVSSLITPNVTMPSVSKNNRLSILPLGSSRSNRGRRKVNNTINTSSCPTCLPTPVFLTTHHACSVSAPSFAPFNDVFLGSGAPLQSLTQPTSFTSQPLLMPNASAPIVSGSVLQSGQLPPGFLLGGSFPPGSNPSGGTPYILPGPFSFPNGCPSFPTATVYNNNTNNANNNNISSCPTSTAGVAPMPPSSTNSTLFPTGTPSGLTAVDPTTGLVTHYPQCIPMAVPYSADGSSSTEQAPFGLSIVYSQPNPNALGFLLPNVSQPNPLVYPVSGQSIISNMPTYSSSLSTFEHHHHQSTPANLLPNTLSFSASSSVLGSMVSAPTSLLTSSIDSSNSLISVYSAPVMTVDADSLLPAPAQQLPLGNEQNDSPLAKDDLISIAWRLTQMDDVLDGEQHVTQPETSDVIGDGELFGTLFQPYDSEKSTGYEFGIEDMPGCDTTEVVLLDKEPVPETLPTSTAPLFPTSTESTGNADIDALLAAAAMVGAASGVGDAQSAVTVPVPSSFSTITVPDVRSQQSRTSELLTECTLSSASELVSSSQQSVSFSPSSCTAVTSTVRSDLLAQDPLSTRNPVELLPNTLFDDFNDAACHETSDMMANFDGAVEPTNLVEVLGCTAEDAANLESVLCPDSHNLNDSGPVTESFLNSLVGAPDLGLDDPDDNGHLFDTADFDVCPDQSSPTPPDPDEDRQRQQNQPESDVLADVDIVVSQSLDNLHADSLALDYETFARSAPRVDSVMDTEERPVPSSHQVRSLFQNTLPYRFGPANMALTSEENSVFTNLFETHPSKLRENRPFRFPVDVTEDFLGVDFSDAAGEYTTAEQFNEALLLLGPPPTSPRCSSNGSEISLKDADFISTNGDAGLTDDTEKQQPIVSSHLSDFIEVSVAEQPALSDKSPMHLTTSCADYEAGLPTSEHTELLDSILNVDGTASSFDPAKSAITCEEVDKLCDLPTQEPYSDERAITLCGSLVPMECDQLPASPSQRLDDFDGDETLAMRLEQPESQTSMCLKSTLSPPDVRDEAHREVARTMSPSRDSLDNHACPEFALPDEAVASTPTEKQFKRRQGRSRSKIPKQDVQCESTEPLSSSKKSGLRKRSRTSDSTIPSSNSDSSSAPLSVEVTPFSVVRENPTILNVLASSSALLEAAVGDLESESDVSPVKSIEGLASLDRMLRTCQRRSQQGYQSSESKSSLSATSTEVTTSSRLSDVAVNPPSSDASTEPFAANAIHVEQRNGQRSVSTSDESSCDAREALQPASATFSSSSAQPFQTLCQAPFERPHSFGFSMDAGPERSSSMHSLPAGDFKDHLPRLNLAVPGKLFADYVSSSPEADHLDNQQTACDVTAPDDNTAPVTAPINQTSPLKPPSRNHHNTIRRPKRSGKAGRRHRHARRIQKELLLDTTVASNLPVNVVAQFPPAPPVPTSAAPFSKFAEASDLPSFATVQSVSKSNSGPSINNESEDWSGKSGRGTTVLFEDFMRTHPKESNHTFPELSDNGADVSEYAEQASFDTVSLQTADGVGGGSVSSHSSTCHTRSNSLFSTNVPITVCCGFSAPAFYTLHNSNASISGVTSLSSTPNHNSLSPSNASRLSANLVSPGTGSSSTGLTSGLAPPTFASYGLWALPISSVDSSTPCSLLSVASTSVAGMTFGSFAGAAAFRSTSFSALAAKAEHGSEKTTASLWSTEKPSFSDLAKVDAPFTAKPQSTTPVLPPPVRLFENSFTSKQGPQSDSDSNCMQTSDSSVAVPAEQSPKIVTEMPSIDVVSSTPVLGATRTPSTRPRRKRSRRGRRPVHGSLGKRRSAEATIPPSEVIPLETTPSTSPIMGVTDRPSPVLDCPTTQSMNSAPSPVQPQVETTPISCLLEAADQPARSPPQDVSSLCEPGPVSNQMFANGVCYEVVDVSAFADSNPGVPDEPRDPSPSVASAEPESQLVSTDVTTSQNLDHSTPSESPDSGQQAPSVSCPSPDIHQAVVQDSANGVTDETCSMGIDHAQSSLKPAIPEDVCLQVASPAQVVTPNSDSAVVSDFVPASQPPIRLRLNLKPLLARNRNGKKRAKASTRSTTVLRAPDELVPVLRIKRRQDATAWDHLTRSDANRVEQVIAPPPPIKLYRKSSTQFVVSQTNSSAPSDEQDPPRNQTVGKPFSMSKTAGINKLTLRRTPLPVSAIVTGRFASTFVHPSRLSTVFSKKIFSTAKQDRRSSYAQMSRPWRTGFAGSPRKRGLPKSCPKSSGGVVQTASADPVRPTCAVSLVRGTGRRRGRPPTRIRFGCGRVPMPDIAHQSLRSDNEESRAIRLVIRLGKRPSSSALADICHHQNTLAAAAETDPCASDASSVSNRTPDSGAEIVCSPMRENHTSGDSTEQCAFQFCVATEAETFMDPNQVQIQRTVNRAVAASVGPRSVITYFPPPGGDDDDDDTGGGNNGGGGVEALPDHHGSFSTGRLCERYSILPSVGSSQNLCPRVKTPGVRIEECAQQLSAPNPVARSFPESSSLVNGYPEDSHSRSTKATMIFQHRPNNSSLSSRDAPESVSRHGRNELCSPQSWRAGFPTETHGFGSPNTTGKLGTDHSHARLQSDDQQTPLHQASTTTCPTHPAEGRSSSSTSSVVSVPPLLPSTDSPAPPSLGFTLDNPLDVSTSTASTYVMEDVPCFSRHPRESHVEASVRPSHVSSRDHLVYAGNRESGTTPYCGSAKSPHPSLPTRSARSASNVFHHSDPCRTAAPLTEPGPSSSSVQQQALALAAAAAYATFDPMMAVNPQAKAYYDQWASSLFSSCWAAGGRTVPPIGESVVMPEPAPVLHRAGDWTGPASRPGDRDHEDREPRFDDCTWANTHPAHSADSSSQFMRKHPIVERESSSSNFQRFIPGPSESVLMGGGGVGSQAYGSNTDVSRYSSQPFPEEYGRLSSNLLMDYGRTASLAQHKPQLNGW